MAEPLSAWVPERLHIADKIFASHIIDRALVSGMYKQFLQVNKKKDNSLRKKGKGCWSDNSTEAENQIGNK